MTSSKKAQKEVKLADSTEKKLLSVNERILNKCHQLYTDEKFGLVRIAESLGLAVLPPRRKVTVLLLGNHSAGKSTFINWYIEDHVQKTGVAIETQGFSLVTAGKRRDSLKGIATLRLYPELSGLAELSGVVDYLTTELCPSTAKKFPLLTFIDTPGLVDGDVEYPYDVDGALFWFGDRIADLTLVFFDPIGQALCKRTLGVVEKLSEKHPDRIKFYLTKSDEAGSEADRQKVLMQIVQELCKRPSLNRAGFDMPTIFVPDESISKNSRSLNQMENLIRDVESCIENSVQKTLNKLEDDANKIIQLIHELENEDFENRGSNRSGFCWGLLGTFVGVSIPIIFILHLLTSFKLVQSFIPPDIIKMVALNMEWLSSLYRGLVPEQYFYHGLLIGGFMLVIIVIISRAFCCRWKPTLTRSERKDMIKHKHYIEETVTKVKHELYEEYLNQSVIED